MTGEGQGLIVDLEQAIDQNPWTAFQKLMLVLAALAFAVDGWANQVLGVAMPALIHDWGVGRGAFASVAAMGLLGVAIGTAVGGLAGDRFGRRVALIGSILLFGAATMASALTHDVGALALVRFIAGLGLGAAIPNGTALAAEFTPRRRRSLAIGFCMTFNPVGGVLAGLAGTALLPRAGWPALFLATGGTAVALALIFVFVLPESPGFLVERPQRRAELLKIMNRFGDGFSADVEFLRRTGTKASPSLSALFGAGARRDTVALWTAFFVCLMALYSMFSWLPTMLADQGFALGQASLSMTAFNTGGIFGGLIAGWALTLYGSRWPSMALAVGSCLGAILLGVIPLHPHQGVTLAMTTFALEGLLISGLQTALYTLAANVYPPFARATGIGAAAAFGRLGAVASSYAGVLAINLGGSSLYFLYIAALVGVCAAAILFIKTHAAASGAPRDAVRTFGR